MLTASTTTPLLFSWCCMRTSEGVSSIQGGHQVAQKFSTTTWPRKWLSVTGVVGILHGEIGSNRADARRDDCRCSIREETIRAASNPMWRREVEFDSQSYNSEKPMVLTGYDLTMPRCRDSRSLDHRSGAERGGEPRRLPAIAGDADWRYVSRSSWWMTAPPIARAKLPSSFAGVRVVSPGAVTRRMDRKEQRGDGRGGRSRQGEWFLFTDADTVHLPGSLARALAEAKETARYALLLARADSGDILGESGYAGGVCRTGREYPPEK